MRGDVAWKFYFIHLGILVIGQCNNPELIYMKLKKRKKKLLNISCIETSFNQNFLSYENLKNK